LPGLAAENCGERARVIERTSTSLYYAETSSSLAIPPVGNTNSVLLRQLRSNAVLIRLRNVYEDERSPAALRQIVDGCASLGIATDETEVQEHLEGLAAQDQEMEGLDEAAMRERELLAML
jgi:hypothetical protein